MTEGEQAKGRAVFPQPWGHPQNWAAGEGLPLKLGPVLNIPDLATILRMDKASHGNTHGVYTHSSKSTEFPEGWVGGMKYHHILRIVSKNDIESVKKKA